MECLRIPVSLTRLDNDEGKVFDLMGGEILIS